jgi:hypothetical protein
MVQLGKRYHCDECGAEILCLKGVEDTTPDCCNKKMKVKEPKGLPSSD